MVDSLTIDDVRQAYIEYRTTRYLWEHPDKAEGKARKYAKVAWSRKLASVERNSTWARKKS